MQSMLLMLPPLREEYTRLMSAVKCNVGFRWPRLWLGHNDRHNIAWASHGAWQLADINKVRWWAIEDLNL
jgi:hypothetical protein